MSTSRPFTCTTCNIEITDTPTFHVGLPFCCAGCVAGGPCICSYDLEVSDDPRVRYCYDIASILAGPALPDDHRGKVGPRG